MSVVKSWIGQALEQAVDVHSQYDYPQASNQCSWCAFEFIKNWRSLFKLDKPDFTTNYNRAIETATNLRRECNKYRCGENIDDEAILSHYKNSLSISSFYKTEINPELRDDYLDILDPELRDVFFVRNNVESIPKERLEYYVTDYLTRVGHFMVVNRYGQSFSLLGLGQGKIAIFDSHFKQTGISEPEKVLEYICKDMGGYNFILWGLGYY